MNLYYGLTPDQHKQVVREMRTYLRESEIMEANPSELVAVALGAALPHIERNLTSTCHCGSTYETYEGPDPECPIHGAIRALRDAQQELDRLRDHSAMLNTTLWKMAVALGEVPGGETSVSHDPSRIDRLIADRDAARAELAKTRAELDHLRKVLDAASQTTAAAQQIVFAALADGTARIKNTTTAEPADAERSATRHPYADDRCGLLGPALGLFCQLSPGHAGRHRGVDPVEGEERAWPTPPAPQATCGDATFGEPCALPKDHTMHLRADQLEANPATTAEPAATLCARFPDGHDLIDATSGRIQPCPTCGPCPYPDDAEPAACTCTTWREETPFGPQTATGPDATCAAHGEKAEPAKTTTAISPIN